MPSSSVVYKSIKTTKALEYIQDSILTGNSIELLGFSVASVPGAFDPDRTLADMNRTWYPVVGDYANFYIAPASSGTTLTFSMQIPAGVTTQDVYITEFYIHAKYQNEVFLFAIGQTQTDPVDFKYIPNTTYTLNMTFEFSQYDGIPTLIINQADRLLVEAPFVLDSETGVLSMEFEEVLGIRQGKLTIPAVTNFIASQIGSPSVSGRNVTLPQMRLYVPNGRTTDGTIKNQIVDISAGSVFDIDADLDGNTHVAGNYYLFYDATDENLHLTTSYSKHMYETPDSGEFGDVVYREDLNQMQTVSNVSPNYTLSNGATVSEQGVVSNLGTLSLNIPTSTTLPDQFGLSIPLTIGNITSDTQVVFETPFAKGTVSNNSDELNIDFTSYSYGVNYYPIRAQGTYTDETTETINAMNLQGVNYFLSSSSPQVGDILYSDRGLQTVYGTITTLDTTNRKVEVQKIDTVYNGTYAKEYGGTFYQWRIGENTFYTNTALATQVQLYLNETMSTYNAYQKVTTVDAGNSTVSYVQYVGTVTPSGSSSSPYEYVLSDGSTVYSTNNTISVGNTVFYTDSGLTDYYGKVTAVASQDYTIECQNQSYTQTLYHSYIGIYSTTNDTYYTDTAEVSNLLPVNTSMYYGASLESLAGYVTTVDASNILIQSKNTVYPLNYYVLTSVLLYYLTILTSPQNTVIYTVNTTPSAGDMCYDQDNNEYGIIDSIDDTSFTIEVRSLEATAGYVAEASGGSASVAQGVNVYSNSELTQQSLIGQSAGENTFYTGRSYSSYLGRVTVPIEANTSYTLGITTSVTDYTVLLDSVSYTLSSNGRLPYKGDGNFYVYLGDHLNTYNFLGTFDLVDLTLEEPNADLIWEWNGKSSTTPGWASHLLCEIGTITIGSSNIESIKLNQDIEFAKFTDLSTISANGRYYGQLIFSSVPILSDDVVLADGRTISANTNSDTKKFVKYIAGLFDLGYTSFITTSSATYEFDLNNKGMCSKYYYNPVAQTIRVPYLCKNMYLSNSLSNSANGSIIPESLPQHSHTVSCEASGKEHTHNPGQMNFTGTFQGAGQSGAERSGAFSIKGTGAKVRNDGEKDNIYKMNTINGWNGQPTDVANTNHTHSITVGDALGSTTYQANAPVMPQSWTGLVYIVIKI